MARIRSINPCAPVDEDVATMSMAARYVWAYLPCHADREGRLRDAAFTLKLAICPLDTLDMESVLAELAARRHIIRYEVDGRRLIQIRNFSKHQKPHARETESRFPPPHDNHEQTSLVVLVPPKAVEQPPRAVDAALDPGPGSGVLDPSPEVAPPTRDPRYRMPVVGAATPSFVTVYDAYPNKDDKTGAAQEWHDAAREHVAGETGLRDEILAWFASGVLKRHPYAGEARFRPKLATVIAKRRWRDAESAPDDRPAVARGSPDRDVRVGHGRAEDITHTKTGDQAI